ncbi:MAG: hypothetical protein ACFBSE_13875, partial [Prochloraceae cyanobacterium]
VRILPQNVSKPTSKKSFTNYKPFQADYLAVEIDLDFISSIFSSRFARPLQEAGGGKGEFFLLIQGFKSQSLLRSPQIDSNM